MLKDRPHDSPPSAHDPAVDAVETKPLAPRVIVWSGFAIIAVLAVGLATFLSGITYDGIAGAFLGIALFLITLPALSRQASRERDRRLFWLLVVALLVHFIVAAAAGHFVAFKLYHGASDAADYDKAGVLLAQKFRSGNFNLGLEGGPWGTNFPGLINGILYAIIGHSSYASFIFYTWLGFWGLLFCYRAFTRAVPEGRKSTYARLIFFLPSQLFWSSFMGKDAWMVFGLGIAAVGVARILTGVTWRGAAIALLGLAFMSMVRPHVAGMVAVALVAGYLLRRPRAELRELAPLAKGLSLAVLAVIALYFLNQTQHFLQKEGVNTTAGLTNVLRQTASNAAYGGSLYNPPIVAGPKEVPAALVTVLFRPYITEARGGLELIASIECMFLLLLSLIRIRWIWTAVRSVRRQPYIAFTIAFVTMFVIAFSSFSNFGLLNRERVQLLPLYAVLLSVPPKRKWLPSSESESLTSQRST